jgi:tRNA (cmo5U34)-methyltransferase
MLARAREHFTGLAAPPVMEVLDYAHHSLDGPYDAVVSALSIHHLSDDLKHDLFARTFVALRPGGVFINAEQVLGPPTPLEEAYRQAWLDDARALGVSEE